MIICLDDLIRQEVDKMTPFLGAITDEVILLYAKQNNIKPKDLKDNLRKIHLSDDFKQYELKYNNVLLMKVTLDLFEHSSLIIKFGDWYKNANKQ